MSSTSLLRRALAATAIILPGLVHATGTYNLQASWEGKNILNHFNFFDGADPTNGFVTYTNQSYAEDAGLVKVTDTGSLYMGVDYETVLTADGPGRDSVRIESNEYYDQGLYVFDIQHMPGSICGTWPAFWTVGPDWPNDGEIDFMEGVNMHESNEIVLHTSGSCDVGGGYEMSGNMTSSECGDASGTIGCVVQGQQGSSGTPFNKQGGGVYAMEWQPEYLKIWFFPRSSIPESLTAGTPDVSTFGTPMAHLQGSCNFQERFTHQKIILDTTFCGEWAGAVYGDSGCPISDASDPMGSCISYVAENPAVFKQAYWELNSIKIYQTGVAAVTVAETTTQSASSTTEVATTEATVSTTSSATESTLSPVTSTSTFTRTETVTSSETTTEPTTTATVAPTEANPVESTTTSKRTSYVTVTTTLCPVSSLQTANAVPDSSISSEAAATEPAPETTSTPTLLPTTSVIPVDVPAPSETVPTSHPGSSSLPPDSVIYTAPADSSSMSWTIISTSSQFVSVPTAVSPSSLDESLYTPSTSQTESPTTPSSPVFTGMANKLSISAAAIIGSLVVMLLA
ncbi:concanavalin A-like lectin/glucanase domain-containing protein [Aspergillus californicus]